MTADQLIAKLRSLPPDARTADEFMQYLRLGLTFIEQHFYELELADGTVIANGDISSAVAGLREIRDATLNPVVSQVRQSRFAQVAEWCHDCGHVHADPSECGFPQGGGRICRCERQVSA